MRGKLKEKQKKMKKIEASMIKKKGYQYQFTAFYQFGFGIGLINRREPRGLGNKVSN